MRQAESLGRWATKQVSGTIARPAIRYRSSQIQTDRGQALRQARKELQGRVVHEESRLGDHEFDPRKMPGRNVLRDSLLQFQVTQMGMKVIPTQSDP